MRSIFVVISFLTVDSCLESLASNVHFPGISAYLGAGYNIAEANPHSTDGIDRGYTGNVYDLGNFNVTWDNSYMIPARISVRRCVACSLQFTSVIINGTEQYSKALNNHIDGGFTGGYSFLKSLSFKASSDYKSVYEGTSSEQATFTESYAQCTVYCADINTFQPPKFSDDFIEAVAQLPTTARSNSANVLSDQHLNFISSYGTHVVIKIKMGSLYGRRSKLTSSAYSSLFQQVGNVAKAAGFDAMIFGAKIQTTDSSSQTMASAFSSAVSEQSEFSQGSIPPADGAIRTWISLANSDPVPISVTIRPLLDILTTTNFPHDPQISAKASLLKEAYVGYCAHLLANGEVDTCTDTPNRQVTLSIFGGIYMVDVGCKTVPDTAFANYYTGQYNCPVGFTQHVVGQFLPVWCQGVRHMYLCLRDGLTSDPQMNFGGIFNECDGGATQYYVPNPITSSYSCPPGYTDKYVRVLNALANLDHRQPCPSCGCRLHFCYNYSSANPGEVGGFWAYEDDIPTHHGNDDMVNGATSGYSCPLGYISVRYTSTGTPDTYVTYWASNKQYVCIKQK